MCRDYASRVQHHRNIVWIGKSDPSVSSITKMWREYRDTLSPWFCRLDLSSVSLSPLSNVMHARMQATHLKRDRIPNRSASAYERNATTRHHNADILCNVAARPSRLSDNTNPCLVSFYFARRLPGAPKRHDVLTQESSLATWALCELSCSNHFPKRVNIRYRRASHLSIAESLIENPLNPSERPLVMQVRSSAQRI